MEFLGTILQDDRLRRRPASAGPQDDRLRRRPVSVTAFSFRSFSFFQGFSVEFYRYFQARKAPPRIAPRSLSYTSQVTQSVLCLFMVCFCAVVTLTIDLGPQANLEMSVDFCWGGPVRRRCPTPRTCEAWICNRRTRLDSRPWARERE